MEKKARVQDDLRSVRWPAGDWEWVGEAAKAVGLTRSDFVRRAALAAAEATANGMAPYFVSGAIASPQNTRTNFFRSEGATKTSTGGDRGASVVRGAIAKQRPTPARNEVKEGG